MVENIPILLNLTIWILSLMLLGLVIYYLINIGNNYVEEENKLNINYKKILPVIISAIGFFLVRNLFTKYVVLSDTFYTIIFSIILAYLFNPIINYLEKKNIKRVFGVLLLYIGIVGLVFILAFLVIPRSSREIKRLMMSMPSYIDKASEMMDSLYREYYSRIGDLPPIFQGIQEVILENIAGLESMIINGLKNFIGGIINTFSKVISLVLTPILTFYFLVDKDYFLEKIQALIPIKYKDDFLKLSKEIDLSLSKFVRGKIIMAAYVGLTTSIVLLFSGIEFAIVIGFITGIADVIPYIGPFLGFIPAIFFALLDSPIKAIWIGLIFLLIQWTENNVLAPKVIGDTTGIHPMVILLSIIIGGGMYGVLGMILSVPAVAVFIILYEFTKEKIKQKKLENI